MHSAFRVDVALHLRKLFFIVGSAKFGKYADTVSLPLDLLNPKSTGFDRLSSTTTVPSFKSF